jgi:hypothetical protein
MSYFDRLQQQLDIQKREQGISALELMDLPPNLRRIMKMMLREIVMKYSHLIQAVAEFPAANRMEQSELDEALKTLVEQNWLIVNGEGEFLSYRVNLRRKAGSALDKDIWAALSDRIQKSSQQATINNEGE